MMGVQKLAFLVLLGFCAASAATAADPLEFHIHGKDVVIRNSRTGADVDTLPLEGVPASLKVSADGGRLYIRLANENSIAVYDARTLELLDWYSLDRAFGGRRLDMQYWSLDAAGGRLVFRDNEGKLVFAEDARDAARLAEAPAPPPVSLTAGAEFSLSQSGGGKELPYADFDANGNFAVTFTDLGGNDGNGEGVYAREFSSSGNGQTSEFRVNKATGANQGNSKLASASSGDYVVVYRDDGGLDGDRFGVFFRRFSNGGTAKDGNDARLSNTTSGNQKEVFVDSEPDGDFVAVWTSPSGNNRAVYGRRFNANGSPKANEFTVASSSSLYAPAVATNSSGRFVVVWRDGADDLTRVRVYNSSGNPLTGVFKVDNASNNQFAPTVGMDESGNFTVAWQSNANGGILYRRFLPDGTPAAASQSAGGSGNKDYAPSLSMAPGGKFCIAWRDDLLNVWARAFQANGSPIDPAFKPAQSGGEQVEANCAIDSNGNFLVSWKYRPGGGNSAIRGRKFDTGTTPSLSVTCSANPDEGPAPLTVSFSAEASGGSGGYSYSWNFGDGTPADTSSNPTHIYTETGSYSAVVTVTSGSDSATCRKTIGVGQAPGGGVAVTELSVTSVDRGTPETIVAVKGAGFVDGATVAYHDAGIDVFVTNWVDSSKIKTRINVLTSAYLGFHDVTVTNPDGSSGTGPGLLRILENGGYPAPAITSISPDTISAGTSATITILGQDFANDPAALNVDAGDGVTAGAATWVSAGEIRVGMTVDSGVTCGVRDVVVGNGSAQSLPCIACLNVVSSKLAIGAVIPSFLRVGDGPTEVAIRGCGFNPSSVAKIKGTEKLSQVFVDATTILLTVRVRGDATPGFKRVIVMNSDTEIVKRKDLFEIKP